MKKGKFYSERKRTADFPARMKREESHTPVEGLYEGEKSLHFLLGKGAMRHKHLRGGGGGRRKIG